MKIEFDYWTYKRGLNGNTFDCKSKRCRSPFRFLKISEPKSQYLINGGVSFVVQSWNKSREKILHSGMIPFQSISCEGFYYGNNLNKKGKKDFILLYHDSNLDEVTFFLIKNKCPRNKSKFAEQLIIYFNQIKCIETLNIKN
ncbi:hypothetical protein [Polaribacter porphyrae]|uniref:Uncharacterized protein n=2 Tax=Polaribacter porphyrae TaxID=1137780 RepID=A0A2S7WPP9_9FLAO|nr:hypothetical protein [Polaribacter porphyrae]PQJ79553.1 hypothetical protein BTO18_10385 [Polaribacter porphyrae]